MELAQQICEYSSELSGARAPHDVQRVALNLTRAAHNDTTVLRHASALRSWPRKRCATARNCQPSAV